MDYYAVQVKTQGEEKYINLFRSLHPDCPVQMYFPKRRLSVRRRGTMVQTTPAVFPGYIFLEAGGEEIRRCHWQFRRTNGFYRFLRSNRNVRPLEGRDLETVLHFIKRTGPQATAEISKVYFDEKERIVVIDGPLAGLEGNIVQIHKRKRRAKIKLDLYEDSFVIDLGFEMIGAARRP